MAVSALRWLGLCGSLRAASLHRRLLGLCARLAPPGAELVVHSSLGELPPFNPDLAPEAIATVEALRRALNGAGAVLIASPEYAHGITGVMKNALDWMVGNETFVAKPVLLVNASARARAAPAALREVLATMSARVVGELTVPLLGSPASDAEILADPVQAAAIRRALAELAAVR
jgi:NAD(P)H-dependent FMN reductase